MVEHTLSNILLTPAEHLSGHPELYARADADPLFGPDGVTVRGEADFTTFLNACSASKWRTYCDVTDIRLRLVIRGDACDVALVGVPAGPKVSEVELARHSVDPAGGEATLDVEIAADGMDLVGFRVVSRGVTRVTRGRYYTRVDEGRVRPVRIALSTTTFRKEHYIVPNIELMRESVGLDDGPIRDAFHMFVVDNGQTLDAPALSDELVTVIPNRNVGGAGGFARGMIAALDSETPFTHVILMDDDVHVFPESVKRAFNLLSLANDRYADAFVNGAMLSLEQPTRLFEDVSHVLASGVYHKLKPDLHVDRLEDAARNERIGVEVPHAYGAWWFSCIPTSAIRAHGLPVPVFVRCDDVEYGLRCGPTYMTMNGVCVWHESFEGRPRASVDCYQYVRNFLVMSTRNDFVKKNLFIQRTWRNVRLRLRDLEYGAAELLLRGVEDYLRGPDFLMAADGAALMKENAALNDRFVPIEEVDPQLVEAARIERIHPRRHIRLTFVGKLRKTLPYDKHLLPDCLLRRKTGHIQLTGPDVYDDDTIAVRSILVLSADGAKAAVRTMDRERHRRIRTRMAELRRRYASEHEAVEQAWRDAYPAMTSRAFWDEYLAR